MKQKKIPLSLQIFLALGLGIAVGMAFTGNPTFAVSYIKPFGTIFLNLLKFVVVIRLLSKKMMSQRILFTLVVAQLHR